VLQKIATGPELSKAISRNQARTAMELILDGKVDPIQAGVFLIALRMKRETDEENLGILDAIRGCAKTATATVDEVVDVADPYDGFMRSLPASPFLPVVLATLGVAAVSHGLESVGPKFGVTHRQVLRAAGVTVDSSLEAAAARVGDPNIGWAYVDQQEFCPNLHALGRLRRLIVKRPAITTVETMVGPIRGRKQTHLFTGYVHKGYARVYAMLARDAGFDSALIVRGVEGGVIPSLRQSGQCFFYHESGAEQAVEIKPADCGIEQSVRVASVPEAVAPAEESAAVDTKRDTKAMARAAAEAGIEALGGKPGPTRDALIYGAALCLWHLRRHDSLMSAADAVRKVLGSKKVLTRFRA
jgi:anthranilate phosphoribosyltransferase